MAANVYFDEEGYKPLFVGISRSHIFNRMIFFVYICIYWETRIMAFLKAF